MDLRGGACGTRSATRDRLRRHGSLRRLQARPDHGGRRSLYVYRRRVGRDRCCSRGRGDGRPVRIAPALEGADGRLRRPADPGRPEIDHAVCSYRPRSAPGAPGPRLRPLRCAQSFRDLADGRADRRDQPRRLRAVQAAGRARWVRYSAACSGGSSRAPQLPRATHVAQRATGLSHPRLLWS